MTSQASTICRALLALAATLTGCRVSPSSQPGSGAKSQASGPRAITVRQPSAGIIAGLPTEARSLALRVSRDGAVSAQYTLEVSTLSGNPGSNPPVVVTHACASTPRAGWASVVARLDALGLAAAVDSFPELPATVVIKGPAGESGFESRPTHGQRLNIVLASNGGRDSASWYAAGALSTAPDRRVAPIARFVDSLFRQLPCQAPPGK